MSVFPARETSVLVAHPRHDGCWCVHTVKVGPIIWEPYATFGVYFQCLALSLDVLHVWYRPGEEGTLWCRTTRGREADAFRAAAALR